MAEPGDDSEEGEGLRRLAVEAQRGGAGARHVLFAGLVPLLRRYCAAQLARYGRRDLTEDLVQEVMLTVHLKLHTYDEALPFAAWLYAVARHKIIDAMRRERRRPLPLEEAADLAAKGAEEPAVRRDLLRLLETLKPPAGEIIHALKVEGASVKALAAKYATSESNIKVIVHRGLRRLAEKLAGKDG